jgi:hypothetical protein
MEAYEVVKAIAQIEQEVKTLGNLLSHANYLTSARYAGDAMIRDRILWIVWRIEQAKQVVADATNNPKNNDN